MANINFRFAVKDDLPAVLEMSEGIYDGYDNFPCEFINLLNDPTRIILMAEKDGKAVGLRVMQIVDEGETAIGQCLRVHSQYRRQGIGKQLI